jgi:hypothetical protein
VRKTQVEEIKKKIQVAIQTVEDIEEPFKIKAFEVVLSNLLTTTKREEVRGIAPPPIKVKTKGTKTLDQKIAELAKAANVDTSKMKDVFEFEEDNIIFIGKVEGKEVEKQVKISECLLAAYKVVYGKTWVETSILWKALNDYGVGSLANLAKNLGKCTSDIRTKGKARGTKYKLTQQGYENALALIKELST